MKSVKSDILFARTSLCCGPMGLLISVYNSLSVQTNNQIGPVISDELVVEEKV